MERRRVFSWLNSCSTGIRCTGGWGIWCWLVTQFAPATFVWEQLPTVLAGGLRGVIFLVEKTSVRVISGVKPFFHAQKCGKTHCFSVSMVPSATQVGIIQSFTGFGLADGCRLSRNSFVLLPYVHKDCCEESYSTDHTGCLIGGQFNGRHGFFGVKTVDSRRMPG